MKKASITHLKPSGAASPAPGRKPKFEKEQVIRVALDLVEREGHAALSMRAVAAELGTGVATLYNYFGSQAEFNDALAVTLISDIPLVESGDAADIRRQLEAMVMAYANVVARHPNFVQMVGPQAHRQTMRILDSTIQALLDIGVDVERAATSWAVLSGLAESHATSNRRVDRARQGDMRTQFKDLDALQAVAEAGIFKLSHDAWFRQSLDLTIDRMLPELKVGKDAP
ncbi:MAG TPA: TetR/AcrR family transcriptional regulator [Oleiagrimonas sp.]|nr:TetR/AcrR family transcriptional regulator [Oleiagrimonas sp.]